MLRGDAWSQDENYFNSNYIKDKKIDGATITGKLNNIFVIGFR